MTRQDRVVGSLLAGTAGDALGAPVEFMSLSEIRRRHGPDGIAELDRAYGRAGAITDDTQMTLFTAEGLLRARTRAEGGGDRDARPVVWRAYLRWCPPAALLPARTPGSTFQHRTAAPAPSPCHLGALRSERSPCVYSRPS